MLEASDVLCPACFEPMSIPIDPGEGDSAEFIVDCEVCCRPMIIRYTQHDGQLDIWAESGNE